MNRIIKFRAWDERKQKMSRIFSLREVIKANRDDLLFKTNINDLDFQEFTGLLDKNGKEIYEGDIIEFDYPMEVIFDKGCWFVKTKGGLSLLLGYTYDGEVIGNVFENKNLLK